MPGVGASVGVQFGSSSGAGGVAPAPTTPQSVIAQDGLDITFNTSYEVGQYVDGSYFVVAPSGLTVNSVALTSGIVVETYVGGVMVDPATSEQGFDNRTGPGAWYNASLNENLPLVVTPGAGAPKTIWFYRGLDTVNSGGGASGCYAMPQITVVDEVPPFDAIKPPGLHVAGGKPQKRQANINYNVFTPVPIPVGAVEPDWITGVKDYLQRPHVCFGSTVQCSTIAPTMYHDDYPSNEATQVGRLLLGAVSDSAHRTTLIDRVCRQALEVQAALDLGMTCWFRLGGFGVGAEPLRFFASKWLNDASLAAAPANIVYQGNNIHAIGERGAIYFGAPDGTYPNGIPRYGSAASSRFPELGPPYHGNHEVRDILGLDDPTQTGDYVGNIVSATANTAVIEGDDIPTMNGFRIASGPGAGFYELTDWNNTTKTVTVDPDWTEALTTGSVYWANIGSPYQQISTRANISGFVALVAAGLADEYDDPAMIAYMEHWVEVLVGRMEGRTSPPYTFTTSDNTAKWADDLGQWCKLFYEDISTWPATPTPTAPTISSPTSGPTGTTSGTAGVTTNVDNGVVHYYASLSATPPSAANLISGSGAVAHVSQRVVYALEPQALRDDLTGLALGTEYYVHMLHVDNWGQNSNIVTDSFTTDSVTNLLSDPGFDTGAGWTLTTGWSISGGVAAGANSFTPLSQATITVDPETDYTASIDLVSHDDTGGAFYVRVTELVGGSAQHQANVTISGLSPLPHTLSKSFTTGAGVTGVEFRVFTTANANITIDNASLTAD